MYLSHSYLYGSQFDSSKSSKSGRYIPGIVSSLSVSELPISDTDSDMIVQKLNI